ncbi:hypothetical protein KAH55_13385 [bacterium]|nr:hypothetical protein [bacterium]
MGRYKIIDKDGIYFTTDNVCHQKLAYMHQNPVRKGFVSKPEDWLYSSARNYFFDDNSIIEVEKLEMI